MSLSTASGETRSAGEAARVSRRATVLRASRDFEAVLRAGCRIASRNFVLRASPNGVAYARLGIIAARKVAARAVDRNRGKRMIREAFREARIDVGAYDVTLQLRNNLRSEPSRAVRAELRALFETFQRRCGTQAPESSR